MLYQNIEKLNAERKIMQFLMKLSPDHEVLRATMLNRDTTPDIDSVLSKLLREETRILSQATLEGKKKVESIFFSINDSSETSSKFSVMNARTLYILLLIVSKGVFMFIVRNLDIF